MNISKPATSGVTLQDRISGSKSFTIKNVLTGKDGIEVSIPNIIVAIVVSLVVIASVVAGVVFIVPWAQNSAAQGDLQTVQSAQQVYYAQAAPPVYGTAAQLVASKAILASSKNVVIVAGGDNYCAATASATGIVYYLTSATTTVTTAVPAPLGTSPVVTCPTNAAVKAFTGGIK